MVNRSQTFSIGPVAAKNPATPTTPSNRASRICGHRAGSRSPDTRLDSRRTRVTVVPTRVAERTSTRTVRCSNSVAFRQPTACGNPTASAVASVSTTTASARRNAAPARCNTSTRSASDSPANTSSHNTPDRSLMT